MSEDNSTNEDLTPEQTEKVLHFQEITHIDSIDECRHLLEAHSWSIELAVQSSFNDAIENHLNNAMTHSVAQPTSASTNNESFNEIHGGLINQVRNYSDNSSNNLPSVNIITHRTLSYHNQDIVPRGFMQWGYFLIAFPFRIIYSTVFDLISFFWSFFEKNDVVNYDPLANIAEFAIDYNKQYGAANHPNFYEGSYSQAVNQAKRDLKFLLIYIHQNDGKDCSKFAQETLANRDVIEFINNSFIFWACSRNLPEGKKVFNALKAKRCPFLGLIVTRNNKMTLVTRMEGPIEPGELVLQLSQMINDFEADLVAARHEKEMYSQTQRLREQQDQAYAESLKLDQEKTRKQRELEEANKKKLEEEKQRLEEHEKKINAVLAFKQELRKQLEDEVVPDASNLNAIKIILKLPNGNRLERIFFKTDPVKKLYNFLYCQEQCPSNFEIVTNFPRKVLECSHDTETPLEIFGINQSMLLFVNDLDA